jgi:hypothetical protein
MIMLDRRITFLALTCGVAMFFVACSSGTSVEFFDCTPEGSCVCSEGVERELSCSCLGGSNCAIAADDIEFSCDGNAACGLDCGTNCLITCPGTTSCAVIAGDEAVISCPGTAFCDVTCRGSCLVTFAGNASGLVFCADDLAECVVEGCAGATDCGDGVSACRTDCPEE